MTSIKQPEKLDAKALLQIDLNAPERLFPRDAEAIKRIYHKLASKWHDDTSADAGKVFVHIKKLRDKAREKLANDTWQEAGFFTCRLEDGKIFRVRSDAVRPFDLGTLHISPTTATYVVKKDYAELFENAIGMIGTLKFTDDKMKDIYFSRLPLTTKIYKAEDALILTVRKNTDEVLLRDLMPFLAKENRDRHVAWIASRMQEMVRLVDYFGVTHNAITLDTVFVSPQDHTISLLGGWWYAKPVGQAMDYVPPEAVDFLPDTKGKPLLATPRIDLEMVKASARELLGDRGGTSFPKSKPAPDAMLAFLRQPSGGNPQKELEHWYQRVLPESFGARRFIELPVTYSDIYQPGG